MATPGENNSPVSVNDLPRSSNSGLGRHFRVLWAAQSVSLLGSSISTIALPWEAFTLTHSTTSTALVLAAGIAPYPLLGIISGVIADRTDRRRTMVISDLARAVLAGALALAIATRVLTLWLLVLLAVFLGTFSSIFDASYASFTPQIVTRDSLNAANGRLEASNAASGVVGPEVGGLLIAAIGTAYTFGLDGLSYVAGAVGSIMLRHTTVARTLPQGGLRAARHMAGEGVGYLMRSRCCGSSPWRALVWRLRTVPSMASSCRCYGEICTTVKSRSARSSPLARSAGC